MMTTDQQRQWLARQLDLAERQRCNEERVKIALSAATLYLKNEASKLVEDAHRHSQEDMKRGDNKKRQHME